MRFLRKSDIQKTVLVISDLHLGAGIHINGRHNFLEDFHSDRELVDFLNYFSSGEFQGREVELIINGDFLDFLAVPYIQQFDDMFWSEKASIEKLKIILKAHKEVFEALNNFASTKKKNVVYIIGNHDAECMFESVQREILSVLSEKAQNNFKFVVKTLEYCPSQSIVIKHGHDYEVAHDFDLSKTVVKSSDGGAYFVPPWGSYYVTRVVNKFKQERDWINQVRPIKAFIIYGSLLRRYA